MALAYVLSLGIAGKDGLELTNFGAYLETHPPAARVILNEPSSWSCVHGVERWRSDCGCTTGGHAGWNQKWRTPLRLAMDEMKSGIDRHYFNLGRTVFKDAEKALLDFGKVLCNPQYAGVFEAEHFIKNKDKNAWNLLRMQESALSAFASCAWFFDDISRIEPVKALSFALRAMELALLTQGPDLLPETLKLLASATSNKAEEGDGAGIFNNRVLPVRQDAASICLFSYLYAYCDNLLSKNSPGKVSAGVDMVFPSLKVRLKDIEQSAGPGLVQGRAVIGSPESGEGELVAWSGSLPACGESGVVFLGSSSLEAKTSAGTACGRKSRDLARHLRDFLNVRMLRRTVHAEKDKRILALRHCLSNLSRCEEAQQALHGDILWSELVPYLPLACFRSPRLAEDTLEQAASLIKAELSPAFRQSCADMLDEELSSIIQQASVVDEELSEAIARTGRVFPAMNFWKTQNLLWMSPALRLKYGKTSQAVGFKP
jgi:hypothetical protein